MRGFMSGVIWGGVVSVFGLGVVSQLAPLPGGMAEPVAANEAAAPATAPEVASEVAPVTAAGAGAEPAADEPGDMAEAAPPSAEPVTPEPVTPEPAAPEAAAPEAAGSEPVSEVAAPAPVQPEDMAPALPDVAQPESVSPDMAALQPDEGAEAPLPGEMPAHSPLAPDLPSDPGSEADAPAMTEPVAPAEPLLDRPAPAPEAVAEPAPAPVSDTVPGPVTDPVTEPAPASEPEPKPAPEPQAVAKAPAEPAVTTNRLPRIEPEPAAGAEAEAPVDTRPLARFAAPFTNPANKPLYSILLLDDGTAEVDRAAIAGLEIPVTLVLDPTSPKAAELSALYRKAGKEVAMLATALPKGAKANDVQVTFESHAKALPEAVAVVDLAEGGFQGNRALASDLVPVIKDQGRGIVTHDRGLNAGDQVARREGVPAAMIFRALDAEGEATPLIRRYLDRAAFKAVQDGRVAVIGQARPDTLAALVEWAAEGRAGSVALAPLTAILTVPE